MLLFLFPPTLPTLSAEHYWMLPGQKLTFFIKLLKLSVIFLVVKAIKCFFSLIKLSIMHCNKHVFVQAFLKSRNKLKMEGGFILFAYFLSGQVVLGTGQPFKDQKNYLPLIFNLFGGVSELNRTLCDGICISDGNPDPESESGIRNPPNFRPILESESGSGIRFLQRIPDSKLVG